ncbi:MAG: hypothetical protein WC405_13235, partial [Syntrophales bacterium]
VSQAGGGDLIVTNTGAIGISGAIGTATGNTTLTATDAITQTAAVTTATLTVLTKKDGGAAINLNNAGNHAATIDLRTRDAANAVNDAGAITYVDNAGFDVAAANTTSTVSLTGKGAITQSGSMTGTTLTAKTLKDTGAAITLNDAGNEFATVNLQVRNLADGANAAGAIAYRDATGFDVSGIKTASTVGLTAVNGAITDTGAIAGTTLTTSSVGGTVLDFGHTVTGSNATNTTSGNIQLVNTGNLDVTGVSQAGGGDLIVTNTGAIGISGAIGTATGNTTLTATDAITQTAGAITSAGLNINAAGDVTLYSATNNVATISGSTSTSGAAIKYQDYDALTVDTVNGVAGITTKDGAVELKTGGQLMLNGAITTKDATGGAVTLKATTGGVAINQKIEAGEAAVSITTGGVDQLFDNKASITGNAVTITADDIDLAGGTINVGANNIVTLKSNTVGIAIELGNATEAAAKLSLTDAELDTVSAKTLRIGASDAGAINVSTALTPAGVTNLALTTGANVTQAAGAKVTVTGLKIDAQTATTLNEANDVGTLAAKIATAGQAFSYTDSNAVTVGEVDGMKGITTNGGTVTLTADNMSLNNVDVSGATITTSGGAVTLTADNMSLNGPVNISSGNLTLTTRTATTAIQLGGEAADGTGILGLSQDELNKISTSGGLTIGSTENTGGIEVISAGANLSGGGITGLSKLQTGGGNITLTGNLSAPGDLTLDTRGGGATTGQITGGGALTAGAGGSGTFTANASTGINLSASNNARTVHLNNDTSGNVNYTSSVGSGNSLTVDGTKNGLSGIFSVTESTGDLTVSAGNITTQGSEVSLKTTQVDGLLTTTGNIDTGSGANITLTADNMNLIGNLDAGTGGSRGVTLQPNADNNIKIGVGAADSAGVLGLTETELQTVTADKLIIGKGTAGTMTMAGGLSLTSVPTLKLISGAGITGAGNTISIANLALSGGTGAVDVKTTVSQLAAQNTSGGITISNTNSSGLTVGNVEGVTGISSNNGDISLTETAGNITIAGTVDAGMGNVTLKTAGALVNGGASSDVDISAKSLNATAGNGIGHQNALHTKVANLTAESTGAGSNNIEITNTGSLNVTGGIMNSGSGGIILDNTGAVDTGSKTITASGGRVTVTTHSPLTVGSGGITAESDVTLDAMPSSGDDTLTINGPVKSSSGDIVLKAGDAIVQNSTLEAANGDVYRNGVSDRSVAAQLGKANIIALDNTLGQKDADGNDNKKDKDKDQEIDKKKAKDGKSDETDKTKLPYCN